MKTAKKKTYLCRGEPADITGVPEEIKILPLGMVTTQKGDFIVDEKSFELIASEFARRKLDKVIDYEHQTLKDVQAPAAGWIKSLRLSDDAVMAKVEWNPKATGYLENKEYKYLSPVVRVRPTDNRAVLLHSVALTNTPAIDGMFAILKDDSNDEDEEENVMDLKEFAVLLGLPEDATMEQIKAAVEAILGEVTALKAKTIPAADNVVCGLLGLKEDAKTEDLTAAIMVLKGNGETVSKQEYLALKERLDKKDSEGLVEVALKSGKIAPAQKEWAAEYAAKDPEGFKAFTEKAPQVVSFEEIAKGDDKQKQEREDEDTLAVCKAIGVSKEDLEKYGKEQE